MYAARMGEYDPLIFFIFIFGIHTTDNCYKAHYVRTRGSLSLLNNGDMDAFVLSKKRPATAAAWSQLGAKDMITLPFDMSMLSIEEQRRCEAYDWGDQAPPAQ
jgi:hypothetical protein